MKTLILLAGLMGIGSLHAEMLGSAFTFQGRLAQAGNPADGTVDLSIEPYGSSAGPDSLAPALVLQDVPVSDGLFNVEIDFGPGFFVGDAVWLQIGVREGSDNGAFEPLSPRQELTPTPHAQFAQSVAMGAVTGESIVAGSVGLAEIDTQQVQAAIDSSCSSGAGSTALTFISENGTATCDRFWRIGGNATGFSPAKLGTTDPSQLRIVVNDLTAFWFLPKMLSINGATAVPVVNVAGGTYRRSAGAASTIGGGHQNSVGSDLATVSGGLENEASGLGSSVSGGRSNVAGNEHAAVAGGRGNVASGVTSFIGGGRLNKAQAQYSAIVGGESNEATGDYASVGGGQSNMATGIASTVIGGGSNHATGSGAVVIGGFSNLAAGFASAAAGGRAQALHNKTFVWSDGSDLETFDSTDAFQFLIRAANGVGINENAPQADLHVRPRDMLLQDTALRDEDIIVEDKDAVIGIYSDPTLTFGSAVVLGEVDATGALVDKWAIVRETTQGSGDSDLRFTFGTSDNYGSNAAQVTFTENGQAFKGDNSSSWNTTSDGRIKTEVETVTSALDRIRALRPVTYRFTPEYLARHPEITDETRYSVVAQEYAEVFPEAVTTSDEYLPGAPESEPNRIRQVDLHPAMVTALAAIQELAAEVEIQRGRIEALEAENERLRRPR